MGRIGVIAKQESCKERHANKCWLQGDDGQSACKPNKAHGLVRLTVLVDEHAERDAIGVEAVEEILDVAADKRVKAKLLLVLDDSLSHGGNHIIVTVTDLNQELQKTVKIKEKI